MPKTHPSTLMHRRHTSKDLYHWEDHGLVLSVFAPDAHPELANAFILDRPKVIHHPLIRWRNRWEISHFTRDR